MAAASIQVPTGLTTNGLLGKRYLARFADTCCIFLVFLVLGVLLSDLLPDGSPIARGLLVFCGLLIVWIGYGAVLESSSWQATFGKRLFGIRVYTADGGRMGFGQAAKRNVVKDGPFIVLGLVPGGQLLTIVWLLAHVVVMHRSDVNQAIHDRVASTWVAAPEETLQLRLS